MNRSHRDIRAIFQQAVRAVQAPRLLADEDWQDDAPRSLSEYERVEVAGLGKMALAMGGVVEQQLHERLSGGQVVIPEGYADSLPADHDTPEQLGVLEGGHPVPSAGSERAAGALLEQAEALGESDLLVVLISGGGTALAFGPAGEVPLDDAQEAVRLLMEAGADIAAMNTVRKHLARVGGGQLARAAAPAEVLALVVSDVVGDDLSVIASGPTVPDPTTFEDALGVLGKYDLAGRVPTSVRERLERGARGDAPETPKPGDDAFEHDCTHLIGSNRRAREGAASEARERGYEAIIIDDSTTGEAREVGAQQVREACSRQNEPLCLLWGGETTVTVTGEGTGGRNQELALAAALELDGEDRELVFLSGGTDGIDGPTDAAGAVVTPATVRDARREGLDAARYLEENNSHTFFKQTRGLVRTGPTHANVMDVQIALVGRGA
jgi:hydroxypyruvate reductase